MSKIVRVPLKPEGITSMVSWGCMHLGKENKRGLEIALNVLHDVNPDLFTLGGDNDDISWGRSSLQPNSYDIRKGLDTSSAQTKAFVDKLPKKARKNVIKGNHEVRMDALIGKHPAFAEELSHEAWSKWFPGFTIVQDYNKGEELHIGKARLIHGRYYGNGHLKKHYDRYGANTYYWHTHEYSAMSATKNSESNAPEVATLGCMEKILPDWMRGAPHNWVNMIQVWYFEPNGKYNMYPLKIENNRIIAPGGKIYK